jgi:threonine dehydrogenase-like Zn-dependent dehydrogenase
MRHAPYEGVEVPTPHLGDDERPQLRIHTLSVSMCGTDIPFFAGGKTGPSYPLAPGARVYECIGRAMEGTPDLFGPGDRVVAVPEDEFGLAEFFVAQAPKAARMPPELQACTANSVHTAALGRYEHR